MNPFLEKVKQKNDLPALPEIVFRVAVELKDPDSSIESIAALIETEPVITGRIIQLANSAYFSAGRVTVTDLNRAIGRLGLRVIGNIVYALTLVDLFGPERGIDTKKFWRHSFAAGLCAQSLCRINGADADEQERAYMAGLMHDIGVMVFLHLGREIYSGFLTRIADPVFHGSEPALDKQEKKQFAVDHSYLGAAYIKEWWPLDDRIVLAVNDHHRSLDQAINLPLLNKAVNLANLYCNHIDVVNGVEVPHESLDERWFESIGLSNEQIQSFIGEMEQEIEHVDEFLNLD